MTSVKERAYAKINLFLDVLTKREDGFHEINTVMHTVSLCDEITVSIFSKGHRGVRLCLDGNKKLPTDGKNLAYSAAKLFLDRAMIDCEVGIKLVKRIPVAAGLAGGSTDAAAVLRAMNKLFSKPLSDKVLLELASTLGSDVPYCLLGGTALCSGRGEKIERLNSNIRLNAVVAVANDGVASEDEEFYGCDGNATYDFCGYPYVFIRSIYGKRTERHYYCGQRIAEDPKLRLLLKSIGGLSVVDLSEEQKEVAAKAIECGFLRKVGDVLEPRIVAIEKKDWDAFGKLLQGYYDSLDDICRQMAEEIHEYIVSHIQKHLLGEWKFYNQLIVGSHVIHALIEKCIAEDMLTVPENRIGPEGVLLVVDRVVAKEMRSRNWNETSFPGHSGSSSPFPAS